MRTVALIAVLLLAAVGQAEPPARVTVTPRVVAASADHLTVQWRFDLAPGWHLYGPHRNDTGQPPTVSLDLPDGWSASALEGWRAPVRHVVADLILDHIYEDSLVVSQTLHHPRGAARPPLAATVRWLVCRELCVPGDTTLTLATGAAPAAAWDTGRPGPLAPELAQISRRADRVTIVAPGARALTFVPDAAGPDLEDLLHQGRADGDRLDLQLAGPASAPLTGLLIIDHDDRQVVGTIAVPADGQGGSP